VIKKKDLTQEDMNIWENYIKNPSDIYDKEKNLSTNNTNKSRFKFDLHGYSLDDANKKVREVILQCISKKYKELLLITGKGIHSTNEKDTYISKDLGKIKFSVPEFIKNDQELNSFIISINEAEKKDGGDGAILIKLRSL
tara:strand:+ start:640 stop:1059 length:420 start_codon:yes stop_codon:yes gene_type:complete